MNKIKVKVFSFLSTIYLIANAQATEQVCRDSQGYTVCQKECTSPLCPLNKPLCQRAYGKCKPKCFVRHCESNKQF